MTPAPGAAPAPRPTDTRFELTAPAKVNLGLRVTGVRDDGYHLLESLFVALDLHDDLVVEVGAGTGEDAGIGFELLPGDDGSEPAADVPRDDRNLAVRAARRFLDAAGFAVRIDVKLRKRIPSAAGLGGGSSDAAAVLRALAAAWPDALSTAELEAVAVSLGADVPFFLDPSPSLVTGIGEHRVRVAGVPPVALVLANPGQPVSTVEVFRAWDAAPAPSPGGQLGRALDALASGGWAAAEAPLWADLLGNDLAPPAESICPAMRELRAALEAAGAITSAQSGSGATVYGVFADARAAERAASALSANDSGWFRVAISLDAR